MSGEDRSAVVPPVVKSVHVRRTPEAAFRRFTAEIATWWPLETHSVGRDRAETVAFEGRVGGRIYERMRDGAEAVWGTVTVWDPPGRVAFTWHPDREPDQAQEVEVTFEPDGEGTRVRLVHSGWEKLGVEAADMRASYERGWDPVLARYVG